MQITIKIVTYTACAQTVGNFQNTELQGYYNVTTKSNSQMSLI